MKTKFYLTLILFTSFHSICEIVNAQSPNWLWVKSIGGIDTDAVSKVAIDPISGDFYITGLFKGTVDFDPGPEIFNLSSKGGRDIFISKWNSSGKLTWVKGIGGTQNDIGASILIDQLGGGVYITGSFIGIVDFDPGPGKLNLTSIGATDIFISKFDYSGNLIWAKSIGGKGLDAGYKIIPSNDAHGSIYVIGSFTDVVDFDSGPGSYILTSVEEEDNFTAKLDSVGNLVWVKSIIAYGSMRKAYYFGVITEPLGNGEIYFTGFYSGTVDFDPGPDTFNLTAVEESIFITKLDSSGNFLWAKATNGRGLSRAFEIAVDPKGSGEIFITGTFQDTVDFDPGPDVFHLTSIKRTDIFILKLDRNGNFVWVKTMGGNSFEGGLSIEGDPLGSGDIWVAGAFYATVDFDPGQDTFNLTSSSRDFFIAKLDGSGNFKWAKAIHETGNYGYIYLALDAFGNAFVSGNYYSPSIFFDSLILNNGNNSGKSCDLFIAKIEDLTTGSEDLINRIDNLSILPNPASDYFLIDFENVHQKVHVKIIDLSGKVFFETSALEKLEVNTKDFAKGIYFIQIQTRHLIETKILFIE